MAPCVDQLEYHVNRAVCSTLYKKRNKSRTVEDKRQFTVFFLKRLTFEFEKAKRLIGLAYTQVVGSAPLSELHRWLEDPLLRSYPPLGSLSKTT